MRHCLNIVSTASLLWMACFCFARLAPWLPRVQCTQEWWRVVSLVCALLPL